MKSFCHFSFGFELLLCIPPEVMIGDNAQVDDDVETSGSVTDAEIAAHV